MKKQKLARLAGITTAVVLAFSSLTVCAQEESVYTTQRGDNLSKIAQKMYGDKARWKDIYEANKDSIKDPNLIWANQQFVIPDSIVAETPQPQQEQQPQQELVLQDTSTVLAEQSAEQQVATTSEPSYAEDTTNMFVGTINGENVVGYLDNTYVYYLSGKDYNATFVMLDENGVPKYDVYLRIDKDMSVGTYSSSGKYDKNHISLGVHTEFSETDQQYDDYYTFGDSSKSWTIELTGAEYSDNGVFTGTVDGTCMPGAYCHSPALTEVTISGSFNFQMQTIHPTMATYRAEHSEYAVAHEVSYVQSLGTPSVGPSTAKDSSSTSSSSIDRTCRTCNGTGSCQKCYGSGVIINASNNKLQRCMRCQGSGNCAVCAGTGKVN